MIKILCDRCGRDIKEHGQDIWYISCGIKVNPIQAIKENEVVIRGAEFSDCHFCPDCMNEIKAFIKSHPRPALLPEQPTESVSDEPETVSEPEKPERKGRKRIDIGKVMALKKAGWSIAKIADEMGMQPQSVYNAIYQYKKKCEELATGGRMSREILFRGKSLKIGKWTQGYLFSCWERAYIAWGMVNDNADMVEVDPGTICQYTGLTDKNGRKIFEGDICKYYNPEDKDGIAVIREDYAEWINGTIRQKEIMTPLFYLKCSKEWEVIGNIFDNPELLEEE